MSLYFLPSLFILVTTIAILFTVYKKNLDDDTEFVAFMLGFSLLGVASMASLILLSQQVLDK